MATKLKEKMVLRITPAPIIAAGVANAIAGEANFAVIAATTPGIATQIAPGLDDASLHATEEFAKKSIIAEHYAIKGSIDLVAGGEALALQAWMFTAWDNNLNANLPLL